MANMARCSIKSLASMNAMSINFYLALVEGEACHSMWGASSHVGEVKYVQFISQS